MTDMAIISAGFKHAPFIKRAQELNQHLRLKNFGYSFKIWIDDYPKDYDIETMSPYLIKYYCMEEMIKEGYKKILWIDSSMRFYHGPKHISNILDNDGYFIVGDGDSRLDTWSDDNFLNVLDLNREDVKEIKMVLGGVFGLNLNHDSGRKIYEAYKELAINHQELFDGLRGIPHSPDSVGKKELSLDTNVKGHRHDTSVLSYICNKLNIKPTQKNSIEGPWYYHNQYLENQKEKNPDPLSNPNIGRFPTNAVIISSDAFIGIRDWET